MSANMLSDQFRRSAAPVRIRFRLLQDFTRIAADPDHDTMTEEKCRLALDIMDLYNMLQHSYDHLADKAGIDAKHVLFPGFYGNTETNYMIYAQFVRKSGRFVELRVTNKDLDSHRPLGLEMYERMLAAWRQLGSPYALDPNHIQTILDAQIHPEHRA